MSSSAVEIEVQWQSVLAVEEGGLRVVEYFGFTEGEDEEFAGVVLVLTAGVDCEVADAGGDDAHGI